MAYGNWRKQAFVRQRGSATTRIQHVLTCVGQANDIGSRVVFRSLALDIPGCDQTLHQVGHGRAVNARGADNVGLACVCPAFQHSHYDVLAGGDRRGLVGEQGIGALAGHMQQMKRWKFWHTAHDRS
jgi:hypothetical protein